MKIITLGAALAALLVLSACAGQPEIPYDRSASGDNKTIGLLTPSWPSGPTSFLASDPGRSFGLIGALVDAGIQGGRETDLKQMLDTQMVNANADFVAELTTNLEAKGFKVVAVSADAKRGGYMKKYPGAADNPVDSYLDVAVGTYGYLAAGIGSENPYRPWCAALVKLVRASDSSVLMQDIVTYNSFVEMKKVVTLSPDPDYAFAKWVDVKAEPQKAATGVSVAAKKTADAIGDLLK
ncbi:MAG TPA: hypothetical protein VGM26_14230 [Rhizomicrobium sp.]|jgi:hypothetical protein